MDQKFRIQTFGGVVHLRSKIQLIASFRTWNAITTHLEAFCLELGCYVNQSEDSISMDVEELECTTLSRTIGRTFRLEDI